MERVEGFYSCKRKEFWGGRNQFNGKGERIMMRWVDETKGRAR